MKGFSLPKISDLSKPGELCLAWVILFVVFVLRIRYLWAAPFDTDEAQHLHVVWGWAMGKLPYRDFFDNHVPLFHVLCTPIVRLFGERADILLFARAAMIPLWLACLFCIASIGGEISTPRAALWTAVLAASSPRFFFKMGEFRTDVLWTLLWFVAIYCLCGGAFKRGALVLGIALAVSLKTSMMLAALLYCGVAVATLAWGRYRVAPLRQASVRLLFALVAFAIIPALVIAYFFGHGALAEMRQCVITHNSLPGVDPLARSRGYLAEIAGVLVASLGAASLCLRYSNPGAGLRRAFILLVTAGYYILIRFCWPIVTAQDYAPLDPLFFAWLAPALLITGEALAGKLPEGSGKMSVRLAPVIVFVGFNFWQMFHAENPLRNATQPEIAMVGDVLALTSPGDYVMDNKGETIFRDRPFYYVLETLTLERMKRGLITDNMIERMIATRTAVVHGPLHMPEGDVKWVEANYLPVGRVQVLGMRLPKSEAESLSFQIVIPGRFAIVADHGNVAGTLDGEPFTGSRDLSVGPHEFHPAEPASQKYAVVWARAVEKGYSPFTPHAPP